MYREHRSNTWDKFIQKALRATRNRRNRATGETPSKALLGYEAALPGAWEIREYARRRKRHDDVIELRRQIDARQLDFQQKTYPEANTRPKRTFTVGERVMIQNHEAKVPFAPPWIGPYPIIEVLSDTMYRIERNGNQSTYHIDHIRPAQHLRTQEGEEIEEEDLPEVEEIDNPAEDTEVIQPDAARVRGEVVRPAATGVDHGPPTSGTPVYPLNAIQRRTSTRWDQHLGRKGERECENWREELWRRGDPSQSKATTKGRHQSSPSLKGGAQPNTEAVPRV